MKGIVTQNSFTSGEINPLALSRRDILQYKNGLKKATNTLILPQGTISKRPGLAYISLISENKDIKDVWMIPFSFGDNLSYVMVFRKHATRSLIVELYRETSLYKTIIFSLVPLLTNEEWAAFDIHKFQYTQSQDLLVLTHGDLPPLKLMRIYSKYLDTWVERWEIEKIDFTQIPQYEFEIGKKTNAWSKEKGWPQSCSFYQNRLFFSATKSLPQTLWGSKSSLYFDFASSTALKDEDAVEITLATNSLHAIQSIYGGKGLFLFSNAGEWHNDNAVITPSNIGQFSLQSEYGSSTLAPCVLEQGIVFHQKSSNILRLSKWDFSLNTFIADSLCYLGGHLIENPISMASMMGAPPFQSNYLFVVNQAGNMAVANLDSTQNILNWVEWKSGFRIRQVCSSHKSLYVLLQSPTSQKIFLTRLDGNYFYDLAMIIEPINLPTNQADYSLKLASGMAGETIDLAADQTFLQKFVVPDNEQLSVAKKKRYSYGLPIEMEVETLPLSFNNPLGDAFGQKKRIIKVYLELLYSASFYLGYEKYSQEVTQIFEKIGNLPKPLNGLVKIPLLGFSEVSTVKIQQSSPLPFNLLSISMEVGI